MTATLWQLVALAAALIAVTVAIRVFAAHSHGKLNRNYQRLKDAGYYDTRALALVRRLRGRR